MSSQVFLWMNLAGGLLLVLLFLIGRKGLTAPSKLNLKKDNSDKVDAGAKNLNVIFMYNGHSFDAYEILGAPAGASVATVEKYFNQAKARGGSDMILLEAAFEAIKDDQRKR